MSPLAPPALRALLFTTAFAAGALLLRAREAHSCDVMDCVDRGEVLVLRAVSSRVDGLAQSLAEPEPGAPEFRVANNLRAPNEGLLSARLYDPEHPGVARAALLRREP